MELLAHLHRFATSPQGTQGILTLGSFWCRTLELPWRNNAKRVSCIPAGEYDLRWMPSRIGMHYRFLDVPNRDGVLIHSGNFAGNRSDGFKSHVEGCILFGGKFGYIGGQLALLLSKPTVDNFHKLANKQPIHLTITESYHD